MLPEEQAENGRYLYELASAKFGWSIDKVKHVQAFHFKGGQGAKTGTGGHLPGEKVQGKIAEVRGLEPGQPAISPPRFADLAEVQLLVDTGRASAGREALSRFQRSWDGSPPALRPYIEDLEAAVATVR